MNSIELSELIYPEIANDTDYEAMYPKRNLPEGAKVTRLGPSPTGFIHLGNLYGAFVDERLAHQSNGVFYLRIEDTDDKRFVENAVETIISSLAFFGIKFDEGVTEHGDVGSYGDYTQSHRGEIYRFYAKKLLAEGKAYPCFLTEEEISEIREKQEKEKIAPGIYAGWSKYRDWDKEPEIQKLVTDHIDAGDPFVIRLKSDGTPNATGEDIKRNKVVDGIRGTLDVPENFQDVVIIKTTGIPTYHFAHAVDDHLMRTTHVIRGEEWLPSLPIHVELFEKLGFELPVYCHTAQLMKIGEDGNKRKLSKRKDPELSLDYYRDQGYHPAAVREYLLTILNSNYEEWRMENPEADIDEFKFTTEKMSNSGALFDLDKLNDVSKEAMLHIPAYEIAEFLKDWSLEFAPDQSFKIVDEFPAEAEADKVKILGEYLSSYNHADTQEEWFNKIREIATNLGYAAKPKDYKKNPDDYKGHVGHVSTVIRLALVGRAQSPDVWAIQQIMGEDMVKARINRMIEEEK